MAANGSDRKAQANATREPQDDEHRQRPSAQREPARPIWYRGQNEPGNHGAKIAEQQFVRVPVQAVERSRQGHRP